VSSPAGLLVVLSSIPAALGRRNTLPLEYFDLGWLALGNADGFYPPTQLVFARTVLYPLADQITLADLSLAPGVVADLTELSAVPILQPERLIGQLAGAGAWNTSQAGVWLPTSISVAATSQGRTLRVEAGFTVYHSALSAQVYSAIYVDGQYGAQKSYAYLGTAGYSSSFSWVHYLTTVAAGAHTFAVWFYNGTPGTLTLNVGAANAYIAVSELGA
jgi:hypothetical protein